MIGARTDDRRQEICLPDGANAVNFKENDPMVNKRIGGVNVFGGGLALYGSTGLVGALGVSGDTSCADHNIAWPVAAQFGAGSTP